VLNVDGKFDTLSSPNYYNPYPRYMCFEFISSLKKLKLNNDQSSLHGHVSLSPIVLREDKQQTRV
jgi:hypothetical protein